jgi:hypothetical protein
VGWLLGVVVGRCCCGLVVEDVLARDCFRADYCYCTCSYDCVRVGSDLLLFWYISLPTTRPTNRAYTPTYPSHALPDIRRQGQAACVTEQSYHAFVLHPHLIPERLRKPKDKDKHAMSAFACFGRDKGSSEERKGFAVTRRPVRRILECREIRAGCDWLEGGDVGLVAHRFGRRGGVKGLFGWERGGMRWISHHWDIMMNLLSVMIGDMLSLLCSQDCEGTLLLLRRWARVCEIGLVLPSFQH